MPMKTIYLHSCICNRNKRQSVFFMNFVPYPAHRTGRVPARFFVRRSRRRCLPHPVRLAQLVSRSQGKWVVERATQFKTMVLDFEGVALMGQGFVDEVFRVFAAATPQVTLKPVNLSPAVAQAVRMFAPWVGV